MLLENLCDCCKHGKIINSKEVFTIIKNKDAEIHKLRDKVDELEIRLRIIHTKFYLVRNDSREKI